MDDTSIKNMKDFAAKCGVSRPTVSKYFSDPNSVRPKIRLRIEEAIEKYDFKPNLFAINLNRSLTKTVGIVVPYLADPFFAEIARSIEQQCIVAGYSPFLFSSHGEQQLENSILETLRSMKPAGVLLAPLGRASDRNAVEKFCADVPTVIFDSNISGIGSAFVGSDNFQSIPLIVDYLCRTGTPPCFFEMSPINPNATKRREAYKQAMVKLKHEPFFVRVEGNTWDFENIGYKGGLKAIDKILQRTNTILCSNDRLAIGLLAAAGEKEINVGHGIDSSLRIAGHDDHPYARFTRPFLTTVAQDYLSISNHSVKTLFEIIAGGNDEQLRKETLFEGKLVMRTSA